MITTRHDNLIQGHINKEFEQIPIDIFSREEIVDFLKVNIPTVSD